MESPRPDGRRFVPYQIEEALTLWFSWQAARLRALRESLRTFAGPVPRRGVASLFIGEDEFRGIVAEAVDALPERFRAEVDRSVVFVVEPEVPPEVMEGFWIEVTGEELERLRRATGRRLRRAQRRAEPRDFYPDGTLEIYGCYIGVTIPDRARQPSRPFTPSVIHLFMGPCLRANADEAGLRFQVRNLVEHELGHHFGLGEAEIAAAHNRKKGQERKHPGY